MFGAGLLFVLALPVCLVIAAAIALESTGGVFYSSRRLGKGGKAFGMIKFRTMRPDSDTMLDRKQSGELHSLYKLSSDPRVTRVGAWLRRYSLDEVPQILNVLRGEMSLVGPRPKLPEEIGLYGAGAETLLSVPPGLTGLWQVSRTSANSDAFMRETDLRYVRTRNVRMDVRILVRTVGVVLGGRNQ